jgi:CBS domain protein
MSASEAISDVRRHHADSANDPNQAKRVLLTQTSAQDYSRTFHSRTLNNCAGTSKLASVSAGTQGNTVMNVENILMQKGTDVATIRPEASIKKAADWLRAQNIGALVVARDYAVLGIISKRDTASQLHLCP